jgi:hypothetical protein
MDVETKFHNQFTKFSCFLMQFAKTDRLILKRTLLLAVHNNNYCTTLKPFYYFPLL